MPVSQDGAQVGIVLLRALTEPAERRIARYAGLILLVTMGALVIAVLSFSQAALARRAQQLAAVNARLHEEMDGAAQDRGSAAPEPQDGSGGPAVRRHRP